MSSWPILALRLGEPVPRQGAGHFGPEIVATLGGLGQPDHKRLEALVLGGQERLAERGAVCLGPGWTSGQCASARRHKAPEE